MKPDRGESAVGDSAVDTRRRQRRKGRRRRQHTWLAVVGVPVPFGVIGIGVAGGSGCVSFVAGTGTASGNPGMPVPPAGGNC